MQKLADICIRRPVFAMMIVMTLVVVGGAGYMKRESLQETIACGNAVYWSRSRRRLWRKGEESGHFQKVKAIRTDCDGDVLLLSIEQVGGIACHTGRESCFFNELKGDRWIPVDPVLKDPKEIYK